MADVLSKISIISFVAAGIFFVLAVVFWIVFHIPSIIGDLSGRTAKKSIAEMRRYNEKTGDKSYRSSKVNLERGKLTSSMESEKIARGQSINSVQAQPGNVAGVNPQNMYQGFAPETEPIYNENSDMNETTNFEAEAETAVLNYGRKVENEISEEETTQLNPASSTEPLNTEEETTVLTSSQIISEEKRKAPIITPVEEVMIIHTDEEAI